MSKGADQLKAALTRKREEEHGLRRRPVCVPDPIVFAAAGTHMASDKLPYTITYDKENKDADPS